MPDGAGTAASLKSFIDAREKEIEARHRREGGGFATATALTGMIDEALGIAFAAIPEETSREIAVLALGGYGRGEIFPKSDVDVMVLCPKGADTRATGKAAKKFLHHLWDTGLNVGHSVRTVDEATAMHGQVIDSWASMLESRHLCGNEDLSGELYRRMAARSAAGKTAWFIAGVFADVRIRHEKFGNSVKLLEPNVKKSAGGLRDVQALYWLSRETDPAFRIQYDLGRPALPQFIDLLRVQDALDDLEHAETMRALEFMFRVRQEIHYLQDSPDDTLGYSLQIRVGEAMGYGGEAQLRPVEVFMRDYYRHARVLFRLSERLGQRFREVIEPVSHSRFLRKKVGDGLLLKENVLYLEPPVRQIVEPLRIYQIFAISAELGAPLDFRLRGTIERSLECISEDENDSAGVSSMFRRIFASGRVAETLHDMNDLGVLGRCVPEFARLVSFFQHNLYHYYAADEHTIIAIGKAEKLRDAVGQLHDVHAGLARKEILYAALFAHDIAKPIGVADHEITGVELSRTMLHRWGLDEIFPDVGFLVGHHLLMEQIAFRRNIHDAETLRAFAAVFPRRELLDYLLILTYADLAALNPGVWTEWKSTMLLDLYHLTAQVLRRNLTGVAVDEFHRKERDRLAEGVIDALNPDIPREAVETHLQGIQNASYLSLFKSEEIGRHILTAAGGDSVATIFSQGEGFTELTIIARDAPFALSKFCAVIAANDANIFDANIFTHADGVAIDRFRLADATSKTRLEDRVCDKIGKDLTMVMQGNLDIEHLFAEHRRKWKRREKPPSNPHIRTDVVFEANAKYTIVDVYGPDSVGALYRITESLSRMGLDIYFAKIGTRVDGIVDAFYVLDRAGRPLEPGGWEPVRAQILNALKSLAEEELG